MRLLNLTRDNEIGANCYLIESPGARFVIDAGMHPKREAGDAMPDFDAIGERPLDAVFVSHSHLDHTGALPVLMRRRPEAAVYMTDAAASLCDAMLHNSVNVMTSKREELGIPEYPLFTHREVDRIRTDWIHCPLRKSIPFGDGEAGFKFFDSGHIMGSVGIRFRLGDRNLFYTGDVHFRDQTISRGADFPREPVDVLIMETTRGATEADPDTTRASEVSRLANAINRTFERGGAVLMPLFAMGKTQELLLTLHLLKSQRRIPDAPVILGGLSTKMTLIYDRFAGSGRRQHAGFKILEEMNLVLTPRKKRRDIVYNPRCIYALSSGMMTEHTTSNTFARHIIGNPANSLLFVGYCDPESPAGRILQAEPGDKVELAPGSAPRTLRCEVEKFDFSGHASREDLRAFANEVNPRKICLVHGDTDALAWFEARFAEDLPDCQVIIPPPGEPVPL